MGRGEGGWNGGQYGRSDRELKARDPRSGLVHPAICLRGSYAMSGTDLADSLRRVISLRTLPTHPLCHVRY
eukprot:2601516-Rhodomonas_salina.1